MLKKADITALPAAPETHQDQDSLWKVLNKSVRQNQTHTLCPSPNKTIRQFKKNK